jgi:hypothetical protein
MYAGISFHQSQSPDVQMPEDGRNFQITKEIHGFPCRSGEQKNYSPFEMSLHSVGLRSSSLLQVATSISGRFQ